MAQKVNPNIFQLNQKDSWNSKYIEKKSEEFYLYTAKDLEIRKFIFKFFKKKGLTVHKCKINYLNKNLNIFVTYQQSKNSINIINKTNENQKISLTKDFFFLKKDSNIALDKTKNYFDYDNINCKKKVSTRLLKMKRINIIKYYKKYFNLKLNKNINNLKINNFFNTFFEGINLFYNKLFQINLILRPLINNTMKKRFRKRKHAKLEKRLISLNQYERNEFFKDGVNFIFSCMTNRNSAYLLSDYISTSLKKLKRHNFFLRFLKTILIKFKRNFPRLIKGIKIKIKGRINRRPRARHRRIVIGRTPVINSKSSIDYAETIAYTSNGTLGIKVWIRTRKKRLRKKYKYVPWGQKKRNLKKRIIKRQILKKRIIKKRKKGN